LHAPRPGPRRARRSGADRAAPHEHRLRDRHGAPAGAGDRLRRRGARRLRRSRLAAARGRDHPPDPPGPHPRPRRDADAARRVDAADQPGPAGAGGDVPPAGRPPYGRARAAPHRNEQTGDPSSLRAVPGPAETSRPVGLSARVYAPRSKTFSPRIQVSATRVSAIASAGWVNRSRSRTTKLASYPGAIRPSFPSYGTRAAARAVYRRTASGTVIACAATMSAPLYAFRVTAAWIETKTSSGSDQVVHGASDVSAKYGKTAAASFTA